MHNDKVLVEKNIVIEIPRSKIKNTSLYNFIKQISFQTCKTCSSGSSQKFYRSNKDTNINGESLAAERFGEY